MILLDGRKVSRERNKLLKEKIEQYTENNRNPKLSIVLVGDDPASLSYVRGKLKACKSVGIIDDLHHLDENVEEKVVVDLITKLNNDETVDGIILQLPVPKHLNSDMLINLISEKKDADGFHIINQGKLYQKRKTIKPATPKGVMALLEHYDINIRGLNVCMIGRSNIVGFPAAKLLLDAGATITICHLATKDLGFHTRQADMIVASAGVAHLVKRDMVKEGAIIVDVGVNKLDDKLVGDVDFENVKDLVSYISPVPGGVGPMTINSLLENTFELYLDHIAE